MPSTLKLRNVVVNGHRTSMRLESAMWSALEEIATREGIRVREIVSMIDYRRAESSLTAAVRVFCVEYFRAEPERRSTLLDLRRELDETRHPYDGGNFDRALQAVTTAASLF